MNILIFFLFTSLSFFFVLRLVYNAWASRRFSQWNARKKKVCYSFGIHLMFFPLLLALDNDFASTFFRQIVEAQKKKEIDNCKQKKK